MVGGVGCTWHVFNLPRFFTFTPTPQFSQAVHLFFSLPTNTLFADTFISHIIVAIQTVKVLMSTEKCFQIQAVKGIISHWYYTAIKCSSKYRIITEGKLLSRNLTAHRVVVRLPLKQTICPQECLNQTWNSKTGSIFISCWHLRKQQHCSSGVK